MQSGVLITALTLFSSLTFSRAQADEFENVARKAFCQEEFTKAEVRFKKASNEKDNFMIYGKIHKKFKWCDICSFPIKRRINYVESLKHLQDDVQSFIQQQIGELNFNQETRKLFSIDPKRAKLMPNIANKLAAFEKNLVSSEITEAKKYKKLPIIQRMAQVQDSKVNFCAQVEWTYKDDVLVNLCYTYDIVANALTSSTVSKALFGRFDRSDLIFNGVDLNQTPTLQSYFKAMLPSDCLK